MVIIIIIEVVQLPLEESGATCTCALAPVPPRPQPGVEMKSHTNMTSVARCLKNARCRPEQFGCC